MASHVVSPCAAPCLVRRQHCRRRVHALPHRLRFISIGTPPRITRGGAAVCAARRRVRHEEEEDDDDEEQEYGHNEEMERLERYSEGARDQALLVKARVDDEVEVVLVFKGFSSRLSGRTAADPAMSVLPERAIIQSVDVVKGPFDPSNIEYLEKELPWDEFKSRL